MDSFDSYLLRRTYKKIAKLAADSLKPTRSSTGRSSDPSYQGCIGTAPREEADPTPTRW